MKKSMMSFMSAENLNMDGRGFGRQGQRERQRDGRLRRERSASRSRQWQKQKKEDLTSCFHEKTFEGHELENLFADFLLRVHCPFCLQAQPNKTELLKHLHKSCNRDVSEKETPYCNFQILPRNIIKCNTCFKTFLPTIQTYFSHLHSKEHTENSGGVEDALYCSCCKIQVPNNFIQLELHLKSKVHEIRRKSNLHADEFDFEIACIYAFEDDNCKKFICLWCPNDFSTSHPYAILKHIKSRNHMENSEGWFNQSIYCCFCDEQVAKLEIMSHFNSNEHLENEENLSGAGSYEICIYCGFHCDSLVQLSKHMLSHCDEVKKIQQELREKLNEKELKRRTHQKEQTEITTKNEATSSTNSRKAVQRDCCISVKDMVNILKLLKILKEIGEIRSVNRWKENFIIELKEKSQVQLLWKVQNIIKINGEKVDIEFLVEPQEENNLN